MNDKTTTRTTVELTDAEARLIEKLLQDRHEIATPGQHGALYRSARRAILPAIVETPAEQTRKLYAAAKPDLDDRPSADVVARVRKRKLDAREQMEREAIATCREFVASLFLGRGQWAKYDATSLIEARALADRLRDENPLCSRIPLIYAILPNGDQIPVPDEYQPQ